jgi:hypothetical protein
MATLPIESVPVEFNNEYYEVTNGLLVINVNEDEFTDTMKRYLYGIIFQMYTKSNDVYIPIKNVSFKWDKKTDEAITFDTIPEGTYMTVMALVDEAVKVIRDKDGSYMYDVSDITEFPINISIV